ncbi:hypothetical protein BO82DRAFT_359663 [Aspergillus uvarum CBS 121591]|uniref:P-loop containing nucleoside triphosphate hydrolase protein n=1 Tax=Aspergillus uvarum CBS 121591 TaxID=1448315 RepID=A0A319D7H3_9EURO|nr:hypothetical protein BO82DRAFT_359663 [Aspergillus uvarum CBS 121591]PYH75892.1 hypothetical protein BO82DRAFT_359663 [Aspergillus uvarum CBS 121591]
MAPSNDAHRLGQPKPADRVLLITYPRTASNLLVKMLSLPDQPNVVSNERGGYFFWDAFMNERDTICSRRPVEQWDPSETANLRHAFQQNLDYIEATSQAALTQGKVFFAKEHTLWLAEPAAMTQYLATGGRSHHPSTRLGVQVPKSYLKASATTTTTSISSAAFSSENFTILPDAYLATWRPTFLIRHPALVFPSFYRALQGLEEESFCEPRMIEPFLELHATLRWTRLLYDWYCGRGNPRPPPLLLDAQDVIHHPEIVAKYCELIGMDPEKVRFTWHQAERRPPAGEEEDHRARGEAVMLATLNRSTSLLKDRTPAFVDVGAEKVKWEDEFGSRVAQQMGRWVEDAMPDYEYLWRRRLRVD